VKEVEKPDTRKTIRMTQAEALEWLEKSDSCSLATIDRDGYPHIVAMGYAVDQGDIVMTSFAKAQKVVNLRRNPRAAVMVEGGNAYNELKGVMIRGQAEIMTDTAKVLEALSLVARRTSQAAGSGTRQRDTDTNDSILEQARRLAPKRIVIRIHQEKWASWDHSKLPPGKY
jgi:PPOX class probable F420-dependent enzyme